MSEIEDKILSSRNILIIIPENSKTDTLSAILALAKSLELLNKEIDVFYNKDKLKNLYFLKKPSNITNKINKTGLFFISIKTENKKVEEIHYEKLKEEIRIHIKEKDLKLNKENITINYTKSPFDLIISLMDKTSDEFKNFYLKNIDIFKNVNVVFLNKDPETIFDINSNLNKKNTKELRINFTNSFLFKNSSFLNKNTILSIIEKNHIKKLKISSNELFSDIINITKPLSEKTDFIILIEAPKKENEAFPIFCVFISKNREKIEKISKKLKSKDKNKSYIIFSTGLKDLEKAKEKISNIFLNL